MAVRPDPYAGFRFLVAIDQLQAAGFSKVRGLSRETKADSYREGGVNDHEHKLASLTTYPALVLERGLADTSLWDWHQQVTEGVIKRRSITITMRDEVQREVWGWIVQGAYPVKWTLADLDAASGQVTAETVEFVHHGLLRRSLNASRAA
jgi:phage tail-like protein